jgi:hypothetical protein
MLVPYNRTLLEVGAASRVIYCMAVYHAANSQFNNDLETITPPRDPIQLVYHGNGQFPGPIIALSSWDAVAILSSASPDGCNLYLKVSTLQAACLELWHRH